MEVGAIIDLPQGGISAIAKANPSLVEAFVARIEGVTDEQLRTALSAVPDEMALPTQKMALFDFVSSSRSAVRAVIGGLRP